VNLPIYSDIPEQEEVITFFLRAEVPEVLRHYHLKEELVVKKKTLTNTESISEELRSEKVSIEGIAEQEVLIDNTITE
jgi:stress response protein YsnF